VPCNGRGCGWPTLIPGEPALGANVLRFASTRRDTRGTLPQVGGSPFDSLRSGQTPDSCLGVKGSPVQIRPSRLVVEFFRIYLCLCQSQQKSHLIVKWPFQARPPITCPGPLPGHLPIQQSQRNQQSRGQRSLSHLRSAQRPRQLRTGGHHPRRTGSPGRSSCGTRAGRGAHARPAPRHLRRDGCWHEICLRTDRHDCCQQHGKCLAVTKCADSARLVAASATRVGACRSPGSGRSRPACLGVMWRR
jgi:hypothetical protein